MVYEGGGARICCIGSYVYSFSDRVLAPVVEALVPMKVDIQQNVARIVLKTFCGAWLEHIKNKSIKFR